MIVVKHPEGPLWLRIYIYASKNADDGSVLLEPGELADRFNVDPSHISNAIARAKALGLLHPASRSRCLIPTRFEKTSPTP